ncbi:TonB-dependent receptor [Dyadobacter luteus]|uniref:TonB-dependent receptor n=2 Tax=Dyadobacter luteus TaxID=2259619 RepID=A0A3D8Y4P4_9BACT|nr:TonB-dependent receptor [Dyadobacter luteus]
MAQLYVHGTIKGISGEGIPGVAVQIKNSSRGEHTDADGKFRINGLKSGTYQLLFSAVGYKNHQRDVTLKSGQNQEVLIVMEENSQHLNEVRVVGKTESRALKEGAYNVNALDTKAFANTSSDINQVLNRMSGVRIQESGGLGSDFRFSLNGLSGNHIKFFIDGIPMESFGGGLSLNNIPVNLAERIEVYKGVVPAYLGSDALGGAVNIVTKGKGNNKLDASYSIGSFNTHRAALSGSYTAPKSGITVNISSYYNFSDNNYWMRNNPEANVKLQVIEDGKFVVKDRLRRFHDGFESYMGQIEVGISNKKWADVFVLGLTHTNTYKERQTGATQDKVIGEMTNKSHNTVPSLRYRKDDLFVKGLALRAFANISNDKSVVTDTSSRTWYQWNGIPDRVNQTSGELNVNKSITHLTGGNALAQLNLNYALTPDHMFNLNYNYNASFRESYNEIDPYNHSYDRSNRLNKKILGFTYQQDFFDSRLSNSFFVKHFGFSGKVIGTDSSVSKEHSSYWGYGGASRFKLTEGTGIKASYEYALRLPGLIELYGNAEEVIGNANLQPENSNNYNLGVFFTKRVNNHTFFAEASAFYRNTKNYIYSMPALSSVGGDFSMYYNAGGIKINGFEADLRYEYFRLLSFSVNMSYMNAVDRERYVRGTNREKITYLSRIPNQPWLYGSTDFNIGKSDLFGKGTRLQFNWFTQFINSYSLSWSKLGNKSTKDYIPVQFIQNVGITYSLKSGRYNITLESRNLTDQIAYDNFKLQKPGRSFSLKLRYVLSSYNLFNY